MRKYIGLLLSVVISFGVVIIWPYTIVSFLSRVLLFFSVGWFFVLVWFPNDKFDLVERIFISVSVSITLIPLVMYMLNLVGMVISTLSTAIIILILDIFFGVYLIIRERNLHEIIP